MRELEVLVACPLCASRRVRAWRPGPDRSYGFEDLGFRYARCRSCRARFLDRRLTQATAGVLYGEDYEPYGSQGARPMPVEFTSDRLSRLPTPWLDEVRLAYRAPRSGARVLDFGCGSADFSVAARTSGWLPVAADFSDAVVDRTREAGVEAYLVPDLWPVLDNEPVDLVRMNHVLEHLYDPLETLRSLRSTLHPGGILHLAVPNPVGLSSLVFRRHWWGLEPRHIIQYTPGVLRRILESAEFDVLAILHQSAPQDIRRSAAYAATAHRARPAVQRVLSSPRMQQGYAVAGTAAALVGRGDRLHALARR